MTATPASAPVDIVIVGAGIVGTALADLLAPHRQVVVVDAGPTELAGSTGHAPGFIGEYGGAELATRLATHTTAALETLADGDQTVFARTGCVEVATSPQAMADLEQRRLDAQAQGLEVHLLTPAELVELAPDTVSADTTVGGLHFPADATADARAVTGRLRARAESAGATFAWQHRVQALQRTEHGWRIETSHGELTAREVVLCTGIWGELLLPPELTNALPIVPVRHPYVYGPTGNPAPPPQPFVRFPEHHVYARWHGSQWGFGTYDHAADPLDADQMAALGRADQPWDGRFDDVVERGLGLMATPDLFRPVERLDGIFAVTPDNLPLVGRLADGLWMAAAIWVTHSVGAAAGLAAMLTGEHPPVAGIEELDPLRFVGSDPATLHEAALRHYNDIYRRG